MVLFSLLVVIITLWIFSKYDRAQLKGDRGESSIARKLYALSEKDFRVFNDVLLRTRKGSSQIDHIVVSRYGIFVIETKNYSGWIHGNEYSEYWTQTFYRTKNQFRNPIKQNWAHIYALKEFLSEFKRVAYYSVIVFSGDAVLKNISSTTPVMYSHQLINFIKDVERTLSLSMEQVTEIADKLDSIAIQEGKRKKAHVYYIQEQVYGRRQKVMLLICPRCGGDLVVRNGQYGTFYGCSNYPKCRYTQPYRFNQ